MKIIELYLINTHQPSESNEGGIKWCWHLPEDEASKSEVLANAKFLLPKGFNIRRNKGSISVAANKGGVYKVTTDCNLNMCLVRDKEIYPEKIYDSRERYEVFLDTHNSECNVVAMFPTIEQAKNYVLREVDCLTKVDKYHSCSQDVFYSSKVCHWEILDSLDYIFDEDGELTEDGGFIYHSEYYYVD